jgi:hypothetical protein
MQFGNYLITLCKNVLIICLSSQGTFVLPFVSAVRSSELFLSSIIDARMALWNFYMFCILLFSGVCEVLVVQSSSWCEIY